MAIATVAGLIEGLRQFQFVQTTANKTSEGAGTFDSLWSVQTSSATPPAYTAGSGYTCTGSTAGAFPIQTGSDKTYLANTSATSVAVNAHQILADRLWTCSGFDTNSILLQSITTPGTIPARDVNSAALGAGVLLFAEIYSAPGTIGATWTVIYTNQAGTPGRTATYTHPANAETVGQLCPFTLEGDDTGVRAVASFQASILSGAAGNVGLTLLRPIVDFLGSSGTNSSVDQGAFTLAFPEIIADSCCFFMCHNFTTATGVPEMTFRTARG